MHILPAQKGPRHSCLLIVHSRLNNISYYECNSAIYGADPVNRKILSQVPTRHLAPFEINAEEIQAVSGIARTMPMLAEMPLIVSSETKAVENR